MAVKGKPAVAWHGTVTSSAFGTTTLQLFERRVVETTKIIVSSRDSEILLTELVSVDMTTKGNPLLIVLCVLTLWLFGFGLLFLILYFFVKHRFLIIHSKSKVQAVAVRGDETQYQHFMAVVLSAAEQQKGASRLATAGG